MQTRALALASLPMACNPTGLAVVHICKFLSTDRSNIRDPDLPRSDDKNGILGLARVLSGTIHQGVHIWRQPNNIIVLCTCPSFSSNINKQEEKPTVWRYSDFSFVSADFCLVVMVGRAGESLLAIGSSRSTTTASFMRFLPLVVVARFFPWAPLALVPFGGF